MPASLRPLFLSLKQGSRPYSGWFRRSDDITEGLELFAPSETVATLRNDPALAASELADRLVSSRPDERGVVRLPPGAFEPALMTGTRIRFSEDVDFKPYTLVRKDEVAVVARRDVLTGEAALFLANFHAGLADTSNTMWLIPHMLDEVLGAVEILRPENNAARLLTETADFDLVFDGKGT